MSEMAVWHLDDAPPDQKSLAPAVDQVEATPKIVSMPANAKTDLAFSARVSLISKTDGNYIRNWT